jgi:hypothetical protein
MNLELLSRYEFNYAISAAVADEVRRQIAPHCVEDIYNQSGSDGFYTIDSLYYDTPDFDFYWDEEGHAPIRYRLRVRAYPDAPGSPVKVEVKRRVRAQMVKSSTMLPAARWRAALADPALAGHLPAARRQALDTFNALAAMREAGPRVLVRHQRQAWSSVAGEPVRIGFDRHVRAQPMTRPELRGSAAHWRSVDAAGEPAVVLEVKFGARPPAWLAELTAGLEAFRQSDSKYNAAVRRTRFAPAEIGALVPVLGGVRADWGCDWSAVQ